MWRCTRYAMTLLWCPALIYSFAGQQTLFVHSTYTLYTHDIVTQQIQPILNNKNINPYTYSQQWTPPRQPSRT